MLIFCHCSNYNGHNFSIVTTKKATMAQNKHCSLFISILTRFCLKSLLSELMTKDMKKKTDPAQYGIEKGTSIQHYLVCMIHQILTALDKNSRKEIFAVIANLIDWKSAFPRQ